MLSSVTWDLQIERSLACCVNLVLKAQREAGLGNVWSQKANIIIALVSVGNPRPKIKGSCEWDESPSRAFRMCAFFIFFELT